MDSEEAEAIERAEKALKIMNKACRKAGVRSEDRPDLKK
jgi:hypothetical protein